MVTMKYLRQQELGKLCRNCINRKYGIKLERSDCIYEGFSYTCAECKETKHIVVGIKMRARWKLLRGKVKAK